MPHFCQAIEIQTMFKCNRSLPPWGAGVPSAKIAAKMASLAGKGRGVERLLFKQQIVSVALRQKTSAVQHPLWRV